MPTSPSPQRRSSRRQSGDLQNAALSASGSVKRFGFKKRAASSQTQISLVPDANGKKADEAEAAGTSLTPKRAAALQRLRKVRATVDKYGRRGLRQMKESANLMGPWHEGLYGKKQAWGRDTVEAFYSGTM